MNEAMEKCRLDIIDVIERLYPKSDEMVQSKISALSFFLASSYQYAWQVLPCSVFH